jgi:hypothetical protein
MNAELKSRTENATTPVSLVGLIPDFAGLGEEDIVILYDQVKKIAANVDNYTDASILISNFVLSPRIKSVQDYHLRKFLIDQLGHFDSSWK